MNRRGFFEIEIKNDIILHQNELHDFLFIFEKYEKEYPNTNFYLMGLSAGSSYGTRLLSEFPKKMPFKAFISISNPFNITNTMFNMEKSFVGRTISKMISKRAKTLYKFHKKNDIFLEKLRNQGICLKEFE